VRRNDCSRRKYPDPCCPWAARSQSLWTSTPLEESGSLRRTLHSKMPRNLCLLCWRNLANELVTFCSLFSSCSKLLKSPIGTCTAVFEHDARERLRVRDEDDWPVLASALALSCPIWSEDADFFGTGVAVWTTSRIKIFLAAQLKSSSAGEQE
jgi:hypothetical protein